MRQRIFAILGAILLVAAAVAVRGVLVKDNGGSEGGGGGGAGNKSSKKPVVACTPDLTPVCEALAKDGSIATGTDALDLDQAGDPDAVKDLDGWITWDPAPQIADIDRPGTWDDPTVLGSSPLAIAVAQEDLESVLQKQCTGPPTWSCIAAAGGPDLPIGIGSVTTSEGIARIAPLAPSLVRNGDSTEVAVADGQRLLQSPPGGQDVATSMAGSLVSAPGTVSLVVGPVDVLKRAASTPRGQGRKLRVLVPTGGADAGVVLTARSGHSLDGVLDSTKADGPAAALAAAGMQPRRIAPASSDVAGALWQLRDQLV